MTPRADLTLQACATELLAIVPDISPTYRGAIVAHAALLVGAAADAWDAAAHHLRRENRELRALLREIAPLAPNAMGQVAGDDDDDDDDIRISALTAANEKLWAAVIRGHGIVEQLDDPAARAVDSAIWSAMRRSTEHRRNASDLYY